VAITASISALGTLGGCGGAQDTPPGPLAMHFDDMYIARISTDQKQSVVQSNNDWSLARMESAKAEADFTESTNQISVARLDAQAAKAGVDAKIAAKKSADASADNTRINQAMAELHRAEAVARAASERVTYLEAYREYLKVVQRHAQETMYWREAQYELAKSQVGQKHNITPQGVAFDKFPQQEQDRGKRAASAKSRAESAKGHVLSVRDSWRKTQDVADRESGISTHHLDPMASAR
jgi:hypothetical protein